MRKLKLWLFAGLLNLIALQPAYPVATTSVPITNTAWTDLGPGPVQISPNVAVTYAISDTTPALPLLTGFKIQALDIVTVSTTSHVWVMASAAATGNVLVAPVVAGGGGGGGGAVTPGAGSAGMGAPDASSFAGTFSGPDLTNWSLPGTFPPLYGSKAFWEYLVLGVYSPTSLVKNTGAAAQTAVTVGTTSGTLAAASSFTNFAKVCVALTAANGIWVNWNSTAATLAPPSEYIPPGQCDDWRAQTGFLPTQPWTAIAVASVSVTLIGN